MIELAFLLKPYIREKHARISKQLIYVNGRHFFIDEDVFKYFFFLFLGSILNIFRCIRESIANDDKLLPILCSLAASTPALRFISRMCIYLFAKRDSSPFSLTPSVNELQINLFLWSLNNNWSGDKLWGFFGHSGERSVCEDIRYIFIWWIMLFVVFSFNSLHTHFPSKGKQHRLLGWHCDRLETSCDYIHVWWRLMKVWGKKQKKV